MTISSMTVGELMGKLLSEGGGADYLRRAFVTMLEVVMEADVDRLTGAGRHERSADRQNYRNGTRTRRFDTRLGTLDLEVPRLRKGSYLPEFLEPRRRSEQALCAVIQEAYVHGVSTRKVEDLVKAMGVEGLSKSSVSRICQALDEEVEAFRTRPLDKAFPYVWFDAKIEKVREGKRVVSNAVVIAYGLGEDGYREVLGVSVGGSENEAFWTEFLRELVARGLHGVQLAISDAHEGLKKAIATVLTGAAWQRCTVHFLRNVQGRVSKQAQRMVSAAVQSIFSQADLEAAKAQLARVAEGLQAKHPDVAAMLWAAEEEILAYMSFPQAHWKQIRSTNLLERLNKEVARRTDVVGIFPNRAALLRLVTMLLVEQNDEWLVGKRYMSLETLALLKPPVPVGALAPAPELAATLAA